MRRYGSQNKVVPAAPRAARAPKIPLLVPFQLVPANPFENSLFVFASDAWTVIWQKQLEQH
jgi:hypothetical protein